MFFMEVKFLKACLFFILWFVVIVSTYDANQFLSLNLSRRRKMQRKRGKVESGDGKKNWEAQRKDRCEFSILHAYSIFHARVHTNYVPFFHFLF